jgi:diaminohydroxyphosphoribosylaminopyrimidine deaminase / 5-amino-6-(5-phosphoribosylamino)uracil reductase
MAHAIKLAKQGQYSCQPNPLVGCVIVLNDKIIGQGSHIQAGREHAEINALKQASNNTKNATCYVTLEPCAYTGKTPPCTDSLLNSGIKQVIAAMVDPNPKVNGQGLDLLNKKGIIVRSGLLENEARSLNKGFLRRMAENMPYVRCKLAMSIDGKTALASGESKWITGTQARLDVQKLRAKSCAIITGSGTILADDPMLTVRETETFVRQPIRVILDRRLRIPASAKILQQAGKVLIFTNSNNEINKNILLKAGAEIINIDYEQEFLAHSLRYLAKEYEVNDILIEAGAILSGAFLNAGLVDELVLYQAPVVLGDKAKSLFEVAEIKNMNDKYLLNLCNIRHLGNDVRLKYLVNK